MKCPECNLEMKEVKASVHGAKNKVISYQCPKCDYFEFESESSKRVVNELKENETPLRIKQKIIKLSQDRLGMYINRDVARSLNLRGGEDVYVSIPDKKHIILNFDEKNN